MLGVWMMTAMHSSRQALTPAAPDPWPPATSSAHVLEPVVQRGRDLLDRQRSCAGDALVVRDQLLIPHHVRLAR